MTSRRGAFAAVGALILLAHSAAASTLPQVIDGHADFALYYLKAGWSLEALDIEKGLPGQADVRRWREGGINGALTTVGSDQPPGSPAHFSRVIASLNWFHSLVRRHNSTLLAVQSANDFERAAALGKIALMPAIEGGDQLDSSLDNLRIAHARGVRSVGIVYDHHNSIGDGAMVDPESAKIAAPPNGGLSAFGREVVAEMNRLGILVDLSHAAEITAKQAMLESVAPVIFSHSAARALADTPRNLSDEVLRDLPKNGGIVMVPLVPYLITTEHWLWWTAGEAKYGDLLREHRGNEVAVSEGMAKWDAANPQPEVSVSDVADQIEHIARVAGKAHVGIGTDFDGMGNFSIRGLKDAADVPLLLAELRSRGWSPDELAQLARGNFLRVMRATERASRDGD